MSDTELIDILFDNNYREKTTLQKWVFDETYLDTILEIEGAIDNVHSYIDFLPKRYKGIEVKIYTDRYEKSPNDFKVKFAVQALLLNRNDKIRMNLKLKNISFFSDRISLSGVCTNFNKVVLHNL